MQTLAQRRYDYDVFVSYSTDPDYRLVRELETFLETFHRLKTPVSVPLRPLQVCVDGSDFTLPQRREGTLGVDPTGAVAEVIDGFLGRSERLLVLCSTRSKGSKWVEREIDWFLKRRGSEAILLAVTEGVSPSTDLEEVFPPLILQARLQEIIWYHLRGHDRVRSRAWSKVRDYDDERTRLAAHLNGVSAGEVLPIWYREQRRAERARRRLAAGVAVAMMVLAGLAAAFGLQANRRSRESAARLVRSQVVTAVQKMDEGDPSGALPWLVEALRNEPGPSGSPPEQFHRQRIALTLRYSPSLRGLWGGDHAAFAEVSADGRWVTAYLTNGTARVWNVQTGEAATPLLAREQARVLDVELDATPKRWITAGEDNAAHVWDLESGKEIFALLHDGPVLFAASIADGRRLVTGSEDQTARVWDAVTGELIRSLPHGEPVVFAAASRDGKVLLTSSHGHTVQVWNLETGEGIPLSHTATVETAELSSDGRRVLTLDSNPAARLWDAETGQQISGLGDWAWPDHAGFNPEGNRALIVLRQAAIVVWDVSADKEVVTIRHPGVLRAFFSHDGRALASVDMDGAARIWDAEAGEPTCPVLWHESVVDGLVFSADDQRLVSTTAEGIVRLWDLALPAVAAFKQEGLRMGMGQATFSADGKRLLGVADYAAFVWRLDPSPAGAGANQAIALSLEKLSPKSGRQIYHAAFGPDGTKVVTASEDGTARVWNADTGALLLTLEHEHRVHHVDIRRDGSKLAAASGNDVVVWDLRAKTRLATFPHEAPVTSVQFAPNGRRVIARDFQGMMRVWDLQTTNEIQALRRSGIEEVVWGPVGGSFAVAAEGEARVRTLDAATGSERSAGIPLPFHGMHFAFSPDEAWLLTFGGGGEARVWNARTGLPRTPALKHQQGYVAAAFSPDGLRVVTAGDDRTARIWEAATGLPLSPPIRHPARLTAAEFSPDGRMILTLAEDDTVRVLDVSGDARPTSDLANLAQTVAARRIDETGYLVPVEVGSYRTNFRTSDSRQRAHAPAMGAALQ